MLRNSQKFIVESQGITPLVVYSLFDVLRYSFVNRLQIVTQGQLKKYLLLWLCGIKNDRYSTRYASEYEPSA